MQAIGLLLVYIFLYTTMVQAYHHHQHHQEQQHKEEIDEQHQLHQNQQHSHNHPHLHHHRNHHRYLSNKNSSDFDWHRETLTTKRQNLNNNENKNSTRLSKLNEFDYLNVNKPNYETRTNNFPTRTYSSETDDHKWSTIRSDTNNVIGNNYPRRNLEDFDRNDWKDVESTTPTVLNTTPKSILTKGGRNYHKSQDGRHICMQHKTIQTPIKTTEVYTRPIWRHYNEPCQGNQICTRVKLVNEPAYRDVIRHKITKQVFYDCCPGWEQISKSSSGCTKPICTVKCRNGGTCSEPETCSCRPGFAGKFCEKDINECKEHKPCDQLCYNTEGSFYCKCRDGFILGEDKQSCKKIGGDNNAFEARELENEIENDEIGPRLHKIEKILANDRVATHEIQKSVQTTSYLVNSLRNRINTLERRNQDLSHIQQRLVDYDEKTRKLEHLVNILFKCRTEPNGNCP